MISAFLDTAEVVSGLLHSPVLAERWERPSALAAFGVSGLAGHLARAVFNVERWVAEPPQADGTPIDAVAYFLAGAGPAPDLDDAVPRRIREVGEQKAAGGPVALAEEFDAARARLAALLPALPPDRSVGVFAHVLPLDQCLLTPLVELVVHLDGLAVSLASLGLGEGIGRAIRYHSPKPLFPGHRQRRGTARMPVATRRAVDSRRRNSTV
ncbi:maleylpyruvate isomerase N-terminal domain-containing protein [Microbispora rosea]|uniref:maleylpyruvate isomerase N-terminal domain-containing protein n=1 Tax=Microbispora rosea TaxID=58117 RepID=UPI003D8A64F7